MTLTSAHLPIQLLFVSAICRWQTLMPLTSHVTTVVTVVLQALRLSQFTQWLLKSQSHLQWFIKETFTQYWISLSEEWQALLVNKWFIRFGTFYYPLHPYSLLNLSEIIINTWGPPPVRPRWGRRMRGQGWHCTCQWSTCITSSVLGKQSEMNNPFQRGGVNTSVIFFNHKVDQKWSKPLTRNAK